MQLSNENRLPIGAEHTALRSNWRRVRFRTDIGIKDRFEILNGLPLKTVEFSKETATTALIVGADVEPVHPFS